MNSFPSKKDLQEHLLERCVCVLQNDKICLTPKFMLPLRLAPLNFVAELFEYSLYRFSFLISRAEIYPQSVIG